MITMPKYTILTKIHESANSLVYRAIRDTDGLPVILKVLKENYPTPGELARYRQEYEMTRTLDSEGVIRVHGLEKRQNTLVIILEDFGGESLRILMDSGEFAREPGDLGSFLSMAVRIAGIMGQIHAAHVIHKDINPSNIVLNPKTGQMKIIDFGISTILPRENLMIRNPNVLEGTLAYMSPEQTGRMNRSLDYRTDFYSLGVTFYELLTGQMPFEARDALEMVHCHLAAQPVPPHARCDKPDSLGVLKVVSDIVLKLMAKTAEDRYQSAFGLKTDLQRCLDQLGTPEVPVEYFKIGQNDFSGRFQIPEKLYGREQETHLLMDAFTRVGSGASELMLVAGYSGVGKSALVNEIHKPITEKRGYFISGKFDQFQRNIPYHAFIQAFREFVCLVLTEKEEKLAEWKKKILDAVGNNGKVLTDVIPKLELVIGTQPDVPDLSPAETQNRFNYVFGNFIKAISRKDHPLVIVVDDLQWADAASLKLLKVLMGNRENQHLLLIAAYRDNEVSPSHPFMMTLEEMRKEDAKISTITLQNLSFENIGTLISDALESSEDVPGLAELVWEKTQGNAFFVHQLLNSLHKENLLRFELSSRSVAGEGMGRWQWDRPGIEKLNISDNVVDLLAGKIGTLEPRTRQVVRYGACIGSQFDLHTLALVHDKTPKSTLDDLWQALAQGLICPVSANYQAMTEETTRTDIRFRFPHDRVQQAAYSLVPDDVRESIALKLGRFMLANRTEEEISENIFDIVNHFNTGRSLIIDVSEKTRVAELNLRAGLAAKNASAYKPAYAYLQTGIGLLDDNAWREHYDLTLRFYSEITEAAYLISDFEQMDRFSETVLKKAKTLLDKIETYKVRIEACQARADLQEALKTGISVLRLMHVNLPDKPVQADIDNAFENVKTAMIGMTMEDLFDLPRMTDPVRLAAMQIMVSTGPATYKGAPMLMPILVCKMVELSIRYGNAPLSPVAYTWYGFLICTILNEMDAGYNLGRLAVNLVARPDMRQYKAKVLEIDNYCVKHWKDHLNSTLDPLIEGYHAGMENGDYEFGGYCLNAHAKNSFHIGRPLEILEKEIVRDVRALQQIRQGLSLNYQNIFGQLVMNMRGKSENPFFLVGDMYDENESLPPMRDGGDMVGMFFLHMSKTMLCFHFREYSLAAEFSSEAERNLGGIAGMVDIPIFHFFDSLIWLALCSSASDSEKKGILSKVSENQAKMENWAKHAPMNFLHKFCLVEAECSRVLEKHGHAREHYDKAIALAKAHEYVNEEAMAHELAGRFYLARGQEQHARLYLQNAHYAYQLWGADAKVKDLEERYPRWLNKKQSARFVKFSQTSTEIRSGEVLDFATIMKASHAICSEIVLDTLLSKIMNIVIENAGATRGFLILQEDGQWQIEAEGDIGDHKTKVCQSVPIDQAGGTSANPMLSDSIVNYVIRTWEIVVLNNASEQGNFTRDPHIQKKQPKSVLCAPLLSQGRLTGVLYLENNLTTDAFTSGRVEVLSVLASQAAISVENARLYARLRESEQKYRNIFENAIEGIFQTTEQGRVLTANPALAKIFGYDSPEELIRSGIDLRKEFYSDPLKRDQCISLIKQHGLVKDFEFRAYRKDGSMADVSMDARAVRDDKENLLYFEGMIRDVTQKKRLEELKIAKEAADAANRAKSEFLANMSHELRAPLNSILGYAHVLKQDQAPDSREFRGLDVIEQSGDHLLTLISDILELSKIEAGRLELIPDKMCLPEFLDTVGAMARIRAEQKKLMLVCEFAPALPVGVLADEKRLRQVLLNLLGNAFRYTDAGQVTLRVSVVSYPSSAAGRQLRLADSMGPRTTDNPRLTKVRFEVRDTGVGIAPEQMERIFEPFEQAGDMPRQEGGTGLGLAISQRLVRMMGGEMRVRSEPGRGSAFWFDLVLPVIRAEAAEPPGEQSVTGYAGPRRKVLIADDLPSHRAVLREWLMPLGFDATEAEDGDQAVELARDVCPDLVLMDLRMPVTDGFDAARRMRQIPALSGVTIIAVSAGAYDADRERSLAAGCDDFLPKPIRWAELEAMMERHLNLEWKHGAEEESSEPASLIPLPPEEIAALHELAMMGNIRGIREKADHLGALGEPFVPFARKLRDMARNFEIEAILALVEQYADKGNESANHKIHKIHGKQEDE